MRRIIGLSLTLALALTAVMAIAASAGPNTKEAVELEFNGEPTPHAFINFNQNGEGDLRVVVKLWKVPEGADDWYVEVYCGPGHGSAGSPLARVGYWTDQLTTNAKGNGSTGALVIPAAELTADCGSGPATGHVDVGQNPAQDSSEYTSPVGAITFTAP